MFLKVEKLQKNSLFFFVITEREIDKNYPPNVHLVRLSNIYNFTIRKNNRQVFMQNIKETFTRCFLSFFMFKRKFINF